MKLSSLAVPPHPAERKYPLNQTKLLFPLIFISLEDEPWEPIEPNPNAAPEDDSDVAEQDLSQSGWTLASTETVTHDYLMQNGKVARETIRQDVGGTVLSTKTLDFFYDDSGRPFALNYSVDGSDFETYYYILNLQGDVVQIIDANGVMQAEYVYSPWGEIISAEGDLAEINPLRYRGYYYDSETGFYYLRSRYYDPENHRFINADTYASTDSGDAISCNMFAYCGNNPVMRGDENGEIWAWLAGALVGAVSSAISETVHQVAEHFINGTPISVGDILTEAAGGAVYGATVAITGSTTAGNVAKEATTTVIYGIRNHDSFGKIVEDTLWNSAKTAALDGAAGIANKVVSGKYAKLGKAGKLIKAITDDPYVGKYTSSDDQKLSLVIEGAIPNTISDSLGGIYNAVKKRVLNYFRA